MKFPNDEDGKVLSMLFNEGINFKKPQLVDFFVAVPDKKSGEKVLEAMKVEGLHGEVIQDDETDEWMCYCSRKMMLTHKEIVNIQKRLDDLSKPFNGHSDGWGMLTD
ncbi:ribonuclease E inhibitor RraB [Bacillus sp. M6-12]|uniref:ribonuclease E inhibitor RraB n=1 Tax=Bacillus sp. M6-12 TaxID=2054166 RepID=UPI000C7623A3|nr:ribonuclease E inhibitor RraB [Bacillus sp. M6-12]PLS16207.1 ribonuclease E inhibitor RraB [Bacillus sp. M6-12]